MQLKLLLDRIYELEGLVHLALLRDDRHDDILNLITDKGSEISDLCKGLVTDIPDPALPVEYILDEPVSPDKNSVSISDGQPLEKHKGRLVFSINDRFRFKKALFDNSDAGFNNSLALVASMDSFEEAEDYFINDLEMNPDSDIVKDFLDIIRKYFMTNG